MDRLAENLKFIAENIKKIALLTALIVSAIIVAALCIKPRYEAIAVLEAFYPKGSHAQIVRSLLPSPEVIQEGIVERYDVNNKLKRKQILPHITSVKRRGVHIFISARGYEGDATVRYLQERVQEILNQYNTPIKEYIAQLKDFVRKTEEEIQTLVRSKAFEKNIIKEGDINAAMLMELATMSRDTIISRLIDLKMRIETTKKEFYIASLAGIQVISQPVLAKSGRPVYPNWRLIVVVGVLVGLFVSISFVYLADYLKRVFNGYDTAK